MASIMTNRGASHISRLAMALLLSALAFGPVFLEQVAGAQAYSKIIHARYELSLDRVPILLLNKEGAAAICNLSSIPGEDYYEPGRRKSVVAGYVVVFSPEMELEATYKREGDDVIVRANLTVYNVSVYYTRATIYFTGLDLEVGESMVEPICSLDKYVFGNKFAYKRGIVPYVETDDGLLFAGTGILYAEPSVLGNGSLVIVAPWESPIVYRKSHAGLPEERRWTITTLLLIGSPPGRDYEYGNVSFAASETMAEAGLKPPRGREAFREWYFTVYLPLVERLAVVLANASGGRYFTYTEYDPVLEATITDYIVRVDNASIPTQLMLRIPYSPRYSVLYHADTGILVEFNATVANEANGILEGLIGWGFLLDYGSRYTRWQSNVYLAEPPVDEEDLPRAWVGGAYYAHYDIKLVHVDVTVPRVEIQGEGGVTPALLAAAAAVLAAAAGLVLARRRGGG